MKTPGGFLIGLCIVKMIKVAYWEVEIISFGPSSIQKSSRKPSQEVYEPVDKFAKASIHLSS